MIRFFSALLFSLITVYSSLAGLAIELHLIDHGHHHSSEKHINHEIQTSESAVEHFIFHAKHDENTGHSHERQKEMLVSRIQSLTQYVFIPQLIYIVSNSFVPLFKKQSFLKKISPLHSLLADYFPGPSLFRNLPLLN